ncbi:MAG: endo-alpha-N-acetylgalactosaminidase family protein [bacterium]|nr:endo-alpha-N-acetylgalactosaminidase family protein [bacterium]
MNEIPTAQRRFKHPYHQTLVYKMFLASKPDRVRMTFTEALEAIRQVAALTGGLKQIVYLVGWQFDGHDSKYPAWSEVNARLKRPEDPEARASLLWLMREARQYNAVVSLHVNMVNAYENSPLWREYVDKDLIGKNEKGDYLDGGFWGGEQAYVVCAPREWEDGLAQRRIDALLEMLPIAEAGPIHVDAFIATASPWHKVTVGDSAAAMNLILDYWLARGVDVTIEDIDYQFVGRVPMVWHYNVDERTRLMFPPDVLCGGGATWNARGGDWRKGSFPQPHRPEGGCLYEEAWGYSIDGDLGGLQGLPALAESFFLHTVPWLFINQGRPLRLVETAETYEVEFSHGAVTTVRHARPAIGERRSGEGEKRSFVLRHEDRTYLEGTDLCIPAAWLGGDCIAYSKSGCRREWLLPPAWREVREARERPLFPAANGASRSRAVAGGRITVELQPGQAVRLTPA